MRRSSGKIEKPLPSKRKGTSKSSTPQSTCRRTVKKESPSWPWRMKTDKIVVLDLDHTLVDSTGFKKSSAERRYVVEVEGEQFKGSFRPNLKQFLTFLNLYAREVVLWTAATQPYAEAIADILYEGMQKPTHIMHRGDCAYEPTSNGRGLYHKPIVEVARRLECDPDTIVLIDDMPHTFLANEKSGLQIEGYYGDNDDDHLGGVVSWLSQPRVTGSWSIGQVSKGQYTPKTCPSY